jgi:poly(beta-D-mannuronate) lyase
MHAKFKVETIALAGLLFASPAAAAVLNPPFDLPQQTKSGGKQSTCEAPPPPIKQFAAESVYEAGDETHSTIDPAAKQRYDAAIAPLRAFGQKVAQSATRYLRSDGSDKGAAKCAIAWLAGWAKGGALETLVTRQAALSTTRILSSLAFAYLEVKDTAGAEDRAAIDAWLAKLAKGTMAIYGNEGHSNLGNHRYWGGLAVGAVAIATGDKAMFDWAIDSYRLGVCQVEDNGALPIELTRGPRSRDYHIHAVAPLVMLAEMGARNGVDTYGECGGALHRLVKFVLSAVKDPSAIEKLAGATQIPLKDLASRLAWAAVYRSRFPLPVDVALPDSLKASTLGGDVQSLYGG